jgi:hypothetical protein
MPGRERYMLKKIVTAGIFVSGEKIIASKALSSGSAE